MFQFCSTFSMFNTFGFPFANMLACGDMIFGGVMERFPKLKVAFLEGNCSWAALAALAHGRIRRDHRRRRNILISRLTPLEYFQRNCYGAVECDEITAKHIPEYGLEDNMVFSTDYPAPRRKVPPRHRHVPEATLYRSNETEMAVGQLREDVQFRITNEE